MSTSPGRIVVHIDDPSFSLDLHDLYVVGDRGQVVTVHVDRPDTVEIVEFDAKGDVRDPIMVARKTECGCP
jgi:hypothetical protein